jgi:hypothetical protein
MTAVYVESGAVGAALRRGRRGVAGDYAHVVAGLPGGHWSRTLRLGPDGLLYVAVGSSCNVCEESDPRRAAIVRYRPDGTGEEIFATGLRNAVGFAWRPGSDELYATDNGRDLLGDDFPPCELNRVVRGGFYGWPVANGANVPDPDLGAGPPQRIARALPPVHAFRAHNAPLGIAFVAGPAAPPALRGAALVALHGSWNRRTKDGYKVVSLHWGPDGRIEERDFATGFLREDGVIGRPVDVAEGPDGALRLKRLRQRRLPRGPDGRDRARGPRLPPRRRPTRWPRCPRGLSPRRPGSRPLRVPLRQLPRAARAARASCRADADLQDRRCCCSCSRSGRRSDVSLRGAARRKEHWAMVALCLFTGCWRSRRCRCRSTR